MNTLILNCYWGREDELSAVDIVLHGKEESTKGGFQCGLKGRLHSKK